MDSYSARLLFKKATLKVYEDEPQRTINLTFLEQTAHVDDEHIFIYSWGIYAIPCVSWKVWNYFYTDPEGKVNIRYHQPTAFSKRPLTFTLLPNYCHYVSVSSINAWLGPCDASAEGLSRSLNHIRTTNFFVKVKDVSSYMWENKITTTTAWFGLISNSDFPLQI